MRHGDPDEDDDDFAPAGLELGYVDGVVQVGGECDQLTASEFLAFVLEHTKGQDIVRIDASRLRFCDSSCLAAFLALVSRFHKKVTIVRPHTNVARLLRVASVLDLPGLVVEG